MTLEDAFKEGFLAALERGRLEENPYFDDDLEIAWADGWWYAIERDYATIEIPACYRLTKTEIPFTLPS